jgi:hypothetical protein
MNQPILKAATNVGLLCTHTRGEVVLKWNEIHANENMPLLLGNAVRKGKASKWEPWHGGETPKSRHQHQMLVGEREQNLNQATQGLPPLANDLVCEVLNEPQNSQGDNQCGIITHTHKGERQY